MAATNTVMRPRPAPSHGPAGPTRPKNRRRQLRGRLSFGHWMMVVCGLLAFVFTASALRQETPTMQVAVASRDLAAGSVLQTADVELLVVDADSALAETVLAAGDLNGSYRLAERIVSGDPIRRSALLAGGDGDAPAGRSMSIPIDRANAVGGALRVGDKVDVLAVFGDQARFILTDTTVLALSDTGESSGGLLRAGTDTYFVTVGVDENSALSVAEALKSAELQIVQATGANPIQTRPTTTPAVTGSVPASTVKAVG